MEKRKLNKKKVAILLIIVLVVTILLIQLLKKEDTVKTSSEDKVEETISNIDEEPKEKTKKEITDWRLKLANSENILPKDFKPELANIDKTRQFDARAIKYLNNMMNDMKKSGISNVWVQSAYRSIERQKELYDRKINIYLSEGKTQEEAEKLTDEYIARPGASDHNLGLAVDFNNVDNNFEDLKAFKWLKENAENYGFILRFPKDKEDITKIAYESWHWRFVGEEHAKKMNELNMCLEEYVEYLQNESN